MAYITVANSKKLMRKLDEKVLDEIEEKLYKWDIYFFNRRETAILKGLRELLRNPDQFLLQYYSPIKVVDSFRYLHPETQPAFHKDNSCERLQSNFQNVEVPAEIRDKGPEEVIKFREWYKTMKFEDDNAKDFIYKLQLKFPYVGEINPSSVDYSNSGVTEKKNYSLSELEREIDKILRAVGAYFTQNPDKQNIIRRYQKMTFLAYVYGDLRNNDSGLNDDELKQFLKYYDETFKKPVKYLLEEYYRVKFNPELNFEGKLLKKIGFRPCGVCMSSEGKVLIDGSETVSFEGLWNSSTSSEMPCPSIEKSEINKEINKSDLFSLLKKNAELFKIIIATHYPFTQEQLRLYWNKIPKGTAHYAEYLGDTETWYEPEYGLCWNYNVKWDDWLLSKWLHFDLNYHNDDLYDGTRLKIGFWDPFVGSDRGPTSVPLDITGEDDIVNHMVCRHRPESDEVESWFEYVESVQSFFDNIKFNLEVSEIAYLLENKVHGNNIRQVFKTSKKIWEQTFSKLITEKEMAMLLG